MFDFRGVIFDVDPVFANSEEWYDAIPEALRPSKDQPFYHLLAENAESSYVAYVSQQNLVAGRQRGADRPPGDRDDVRWHGRRPLPAAARAPALSRRRLTLRSPCHRRLAFPSAATLSRAYTRAGTGIL